MGKRIILFLILFSLFLSSVPLEKSPYPVRDRLKCDVQVKGVDFFYVLNIYPSDKNPVLFHWEAIIKHVNSGKILTILRCSSMRGQENIFERVYRPNGSKIIITCSIDPSKPLIRYHIRRLMGETILYSYKGKKEIHL
jgi:hypothetical protein